MSRSRESKRERMKRLLGLLDYRKKHPGGPSIFPKQMVSDRRQRKKTLCRLFGISGRQYVKLRRLALSGVKDCELEDFIKRVSKKSNKEIDNIKQRGGIKDVY